MTVGSLNLIVILIITRTPSTVQQSACVPLVVSEETILEPPAPANMLGEMVRVSCPPGYSFNQQVHAGLDHVTLQCLSEGWNTTATPSCRDPSNCETIQYGRTKDPIDYFGEGWADPSSYMPDGYWPPQRPAVMHEVYVPAKTGPACDPLEASGIPSDAGERILVFGNGTEYGTIYQYICQLGYHLVPVIAFTQCKGQWRNLPSNQSQPTCHINRCQLPMLPDNSPITLTRAASSGSELLVDYGELVSVSCATGYHVVGNETLECLEDGLSSLPACQDIDECIMGTSSCDDVCYNTVGSFRCACTSGFRLINSTSCQDINECEDSPSLCANGECVNTVGSYMCQCDEMDGYVLFVTDGQEGHVIPDTEKQLNSIHNILHINHTCVLRQCEFPQAGIPNADIISGLSSLYHTGDVLLIDCRLGYIMTGVAMVSCTTQGNWSTEFPVCQEASCPLPQHMGELRPPTYRNKTTDTVLVSDSRVAFDTSIIRSCVTYGQTDEVEMRCHYNMDTDSYVITEISCPEVRCEPEYMDVYVGSGSLIHINGTFNVYNSFYRLLCAPGASFIGNSTLVEPNVVMCGEDGLWVLGTAFCNSNLCPDAGTPVGGTQSVLGDYTLGTTLTYICSEDGFVPQPDPTGTCVVTQNGDQEWNFTQGVTRGQDVECVDTEPPVLICPPNILVNHGTWLTLEEFTFNVSDNYGGAVFVSYSFNPLTLPSIELVDIEYPSYRIQDNTMVTVTADTPNTNKVAPPSNCIFSIAVQDSCGEPPVLENAFRSCSEPGCIFLCEDNFVLWNGEEIDTREVPVMTCEYDGHTQPQWQFIGECVAGNVSSVVTAYIDLNITLFFDNITQACVGDLLDGFFNTSFGNGTCFPMSEVQIHLISITNVQDGFIIRSAATISTGANKVGKIETCLDFIQMLVTAFEKTEYIEDTMCGSFQLSAFSISTSEILSKCPEGEAEYDGLCYPCLPGTFMNNGTCEQCPPNSYSDTTHALSCIPCSSGRTPPFIIARSEVDCVECPSSLCQNGGTCEGDFAFVCICPPGFTGTFCQNDIRPCSSNPCRFGGICTEDTDLITFQCSCSQGYSGDACEIHNFCRSSNCGNRGICIEMDSGAECRCQPMVTGDGCDVTLDPCTEAPCENGATCTPVGEVRRLCTCEPGWSGANCSLDIDECFSGPCINGGTCEDGINGFTCQCAVGFDGFDCSIPMSCPTDDNLDPACPVCVEDYRQGGQICVCSDGYDSVSEDVASCVLQQPCSNNPCINGGTCNDQNQPPGGYACACVSGFGGQNCQINLDDCLTNPCGDDGVCQDQVDGYLCQCIDSLSDTGFYLGQSCIGGCALNGCDPDGTISCTDVLNDYICTCKEGYTGNNCEVDIDYCETGLCHNGGTCIDGDTSFTCLCPDGWAGPTCSELLHLCSTSSCKNSEPCFDLLNDYFCLCENIVNEDCDSRVSICADPNRCYNGGTCIAGDNDGFVCSCTASYSGNDCFLTRDVCLDQCSTNRKCPSDVPRFYCRRQEGESAVLISFTYTKPFSRWTDDSILLDCSNNCTTIQDGLANEFGRVQFMGTAPSTDRNTSFALQSLAFPSQLPAVDDLVSQWDLTVATFSMAESIFSHVIPALGPQAGGTILTILGHNIPSDIHIQIGTYNCSTLQRSSIFLTCTSNTVNDIDVGAPLQINATSAEGTQSIGFAFLYIENPTVSSVFPLEHFESGGTTLEVNGTNMDAIHTPVLRTDVVSRDTGASRTYFTFCEPGKVIICEAANISDFKQSVGLESQRRKRHTQHTLWRFRRQTIELAVSVNEADNVDIFIGLELDGVQDYKNLTANPNTTQYGGITAYRDPTLERFAGEDGVLEFRSTWPFHERLIEIKGSGLMPGIRTQEIVVNIGPVRCDITLHTANLIECEPPTKRPTSPPDGRIPVDVNIGNLNFQIGHVFYIQTIWEFLPAKYGIIASICFFLVLFALITLAVLRHNAPGLFIRCRTNREYHTVRSSEDEGRQRAFASIAIRMSARGYPTNSYSSIMSSLGSTRPFR